MLFEQILNIGVKLSDILYSFKYFKLFSIVIVCFVQKLSDKIERILFD